jgi:HK97 family phage prohead protease
MTTYVTRDLDMNTAEAQPPDGGPRRNLKQVMSAVQTAAVNYDFNLARQDVREDDDGTLTIAGYASNWDLDRQDEAMAPTAFDKALQRYRQNPILLYMHRLDFPMGRVTQAHIDEKGLFVEAKLPKPEPGTEAAHVWRLVKAGVIRAFSVGGKGTRAIVNGVKRVTSWDLAEISIAPVGVNPTTTFSIQAGKCFDAAAGDDLADVRYAADRIAATAALARVDDALRRARRTADLATLRADLASL